MNNDTISALVGRAESLAQKSGQSLSTISRKLLNDGKGLTRLKEGGQLTLKTLAAATAKLDALESAQEGSSLEDDPPGSSGG